MYPEIGFCIYCGTPHDLTSEHIMPYGLGGNLELPSSSCKVCATITGRIEQTVLRGPLRPICVYRRIQSRRKHKDAPTKLPLEVRFGTEWETIQLPVDEYPLLLTFFNYEIPGYLDPKNYKSGVRVSGQYTYSFGPRLEEVIKRIGAKDIRVSQSYVPSEFAKMTAKVAYSMAVAIGQINPTMGRPKVVNAILGKTDDIGRWVWTVSEPRKRLKDILHFIGIERDEKQGLLIGRVQYLTDSGTPMYGVILGKLDDKFIAPVV